ncbi:MAG: NADH-quinone oxidoreductase subunit C, partial [Selenomonadales bacterium]|nr:NADH-quinone oxidoreductase subunit C [Selenomonadales bacterium]
MEMSRKQFVVLLRQHFGKSHVIEHAPRRVEVHVEREDIESVCRWLKTEEDARLMTMVGTDERPLGASFALYYVYGIDRYQTIVTVSVSIPEDDPTFPSMAAEFPALNWYEREVNDLLGLRAVGHPDRSPLVLKAGWPSGEYPLRKDYDREKT